MKPMLGASHLTKLENVKRVWQLKEYAEYPHDIMDIFGISNEIATNFEYFIMFIMKRKKKS